MLLMVALSLSFFAGRALAQDPSTQPDSTAQQADSTAQQGLETAHALGRAFAHVAHEASSAVVFVTVEKEIPAQALPNIPFPDLPEEFRRFFQPPPNETPNPAPRHAEGEGSGFLITADGLIVTNNHVVSNASKVTVRLEDGREFDGKVLGQDPKSDVALVRIDAKNLPHLTLGDSKSLKVGQWVLAIGNPFGLQTTVTAGIVSATGRTSLGILDYEDFIQTDAAINPGNSGGPLLDLDGKVVGMNAAIYSRSGGNVGVGFAIPADLIDYVRKNLLENGEVRRGFLGVSIQALTQDLSQSFGVKPESGVLVSAVSADSPAKKAGLEPGDVIVSVDGIATHDPGMLRNRIARYAPGQPVTLDVIRSGEKRTVQVTLGAWTQQEKESGTAAPTSAVEEFGLTVGALTPDRRSQLSLPEGTKGVVVTKVAPDSVAALAGLRPGAVIVEADRQPVDDPAKLQDVLGKVAKGGSVLLRVREGENTLYVVLERGS
jgi:serine protease Do